MKKIIFDQYGNPTLILHKNGRLVSFNGQSIGFLDGDSVYDYNGRHRGWLKEGVLRDHDGSCVGFTREARKSFVPIFPITKIVPIASIVAIEPIRPIKSIKPIRPIKKLSWSIFNPLSLFNL